MKRSALLVVFTLAVALTAVAAGRPALAAQPYHLGVALGLTGTGAPYSRDALDGIRLAVDEINAQGGFLGQHRIELFVSNTKTAPEVAKTAVKSRSRPSEPTVHPNYSRVASTKDFSYFFRGQPALAEETRE